MLVVVVVLVVVAFVFDVDFLACVDDFLTGAGVAAEWSFYNGSYRAARFN